MVLRGNLPEEDIQAVRAVHAHHILAGLGGMGYREGEGYGNHGLGPGRENVLGEGSRPGGMVSLVEGMATRAAEDVGLAVRRSLERAKGMASDHGAGEKCTPQEADLEAGIPSSLAAGEGIDLGRRSSR